jgi:hypothetical protein
MQPPFCGRIPRFDRVFWPHYPTQIGTLTRAFGGIYVK